VRALNFLKAIICVFTKILYLLVRVCSCNHSTNGNNYNIYQLVKLIIVTAIFNPMKKGAYRFCLHWQPIVFVAICITQSKRNV
jgi:hypothetical protein